MTEEQIRVHALARIADVFGLRRTEIRAGLQFGVDLVAKSRSDFRRNEFDRILDDIRDVADRDTVAELESGRHTISTVEDYCNHMVHCFRTKPDGVRDVLRIPLTNS
jgi:hypothetical protein